MLISEATDSIKRFCNQETAAGGAMDPAMSRDHVLWGGSVGKSGVRGPRPSP